MSESTIAARSVVTCKRFEGGEVAYGKLVETGRGTPPANAAPAA